MHRNWGSRRLRSLSRACRRASGVIRLRPVTALALPIVLGTLLCTAWLAREVFSGLPTTAELAVAGRAPQATVLYDHADHPISTLFREQRMDVPLDSISPFLPQAVLAMEDRRFFEHQGIDVRRILGAAWQNLREGRRAQGASTITQQLARLRFLTLDKTLRRKVREAILARRLERIYSKQEILELYLNQIYFGGGFYGAEAAARGYFGHSAAELDLAQAAMLAGLVQAPSFYDPTVNLERAIARRDLVLRVMHDLGVIDETQWQAAGQAEVVLHDGLGRRQPTGEYFVEEVRQQLVARFGVERVYEGGLRVFTTIDPVMQREAEKAVASSITRIEARQASRSRAARPAEDVDADDPLQAALVAVDPRSGEIRALVGGRNFRASEFNRAVQARRQPGSAFKPFVYAAAIEAGHMPASLIDRLDEPIDMHQGPWLAEDAHATEAVMTMRAALRQSSNRAAVRMLETIGVSQVAAYAEQLGLGPVPAVPSMALGSGEVSLLSMTLAYATFADRGFLHQPTFIRRVVDEEGMVLFEAAPVPTRPLRETTAFLMAEMLADVVDAGTGAGVRRLGFTRPAGGKTGTTNDFADAWFVGFTPDLVAGVWIGFDRPRTIVGNGYASELAVPLWTEFMDAATRANPPAWFAPPPGIVAVPICELSGKRAGEGCRHATVADEHGVRAGRDLVRLEYFAEGTEPLEVCDLHANRSFFGSLARVFNGSTPRPIAGSGDGEPEAYQARRADAVDAPGANDAPADPERQERGFWARLFRFGR